MILTVPSGFGKNKEEKGWWCTVPQKYRPDYCSQNPRCFPGTLKTCDLRRQTGVHRRARRTITNDCNHGTSFTATTTKPTKQKKLNITTTPRQNFLRETHRIPPKCSPVEGLSPPSTARFLSAQPGSHHLSFSLYLEIHYLISLDAIGSKWNCWTILGTIGSK